MTQQESQAARILAKYHANSGDERDPLVMFEMAQIRHALKLEREYARSTNFLSLFRTPGNRRRMRIIIAIALFSQWRYDTIHRCARRTYSHTIYSGNGLVSYYINLVLEGVGITDAGVKAEVNGGLQVIPQYLDSERELKEGNF